MRKLLVVMAALVAGAVLYPAAAGSAEEWCWNDPTLAINGRAVHFQIGAPISKKELVRNTALTVVIPSNVSANLTGAGNENFPMSVTLLQTGAPWLGFGPIPVSATAVVSVDGSVPTALKVVQANLGEIGGASGLGGVSMLAPVLVQ